MIHYWDDVEGKKERKRKKSSSVKEEYYVREMRRKRIPRNPKATNVRFYQS